MQGLLALASSTSTSSSEIGSPDIAGSLMVIGVFGAFLVSAVALIYAHSARGETKRQTKQMRIQAEQSKRLSDITEKALGLQRDEFEQNKSELAKRDRRFLSTKKESISTTLSNGSLSLFPQSL